MAAWAFGAAAAPPPAAATGSEFKMPGWLTDLSLGVKETYDDNLLLVAGKSTAANPAAMSPQGSWISTVSPKLGFDFAPLLGDQKTFQTLSLVYSPDFVLIHEMPSENYNAQKIGNKIKGHTGNFSGAVDSDFLFNDGSSTAPTYGLGSSADQGDKCGSAFAPAIVRERLKQIQERATVTLQYDTDRFFIRPTASLLYYDFMTQRVGSLYRLSKFYRSHGCQRRRRLGLQADFHPGGHLGLSLRPSIPAGVYS